MYREGLHVMTHEDHRFILNHGALGDMITSLPAIIHGRMATPELMKMTVYVAKWQVDLVKHLLAPYGMFDVLPMDAVPPKAEDRRAQWGEDVSTSQNAPAFNTHTRNRVHMVDFAFNFLIDARPENAEQRSYPIMAPLGSKKIEGDYVVFPVGATTDNKLFKAKVMAPVIRWCVDNYLTPVLVGTKMSHTMAESNGTLEKLTIRDEVDMLPPGLLEACVDMREKTTLLELRDILGHARAVVGVDGGTLHLAGTTEVPIVFAMGSVHPRHRFVYRRGDPFYRIRYVVPRDLACWGCQSHWQMTRWDFRHCPYGDSKCMDMLHPDDFIDALEELFMGGAALPAGSTSAEELKKVETPAVPPEAALAAVVEAESKPANEAESKPEDLDV